MRALLAAALAVLCAVPTLAQTPLFTPLDGTQRLALSPSQSQFLTALESERGVEAVDLVIAEARQLDAKATLELALPDVTVTLEALSATPRRTGHLSWVGRTASGSGVSAWAVLVERDGMITGEVHTGGYIYPIRPLTGGLHAVARKSMADYQMHPEDYATFRAEADDLMGLDRQLEDRPAVQSRAAGPSTTVIDILVPYSMDVADGIADPVALAQAFVDYANLTYTNSVVDMELNLVYAYETPYTTSGSLSTDLSRLRLTTDGNMDEVHGIRTSYGADLVALLSGTNSSGTCGVGYVNSSSSAFGFSVTSGGCSSTTFVHEVGHNMGSDHDPLTDDDPDPTDGTNDPDYDTFARGYVDQAGDWGTVMAYNVACDDDATPGAPPFSAFCEIIPYLSNPDVTYDDTTAPENDGSTGDATVGDNARVHEERMATVAGYFGTKANPDADFAATSLALTVVPGGSVTGSIALSNIAGGTSSPLSWTGDFDNLDDAGGTPVANACTGREGVSQTSISFFDSHSSGGSEIGQSFTAPCSGTLTRVSPAFYGGAGGSWTGTLRIYDGAGTGGTELATLALSETNAPDGTVSYLDFNLATPVEIVEGQVYTWFVDMASGDTRSLYSSVNPYSGGTRYETSNGNPANASAQSSNDAAFRLRFAPPDQWASLPSQIGSIDPGSSSDLSFTFDATGYTEGTYTGDLVVATNDPSAATTTIALTMTVAETPTYTFNNGYGWRLMAAPGDATTVATLAEQNLVQGVTGSYETFDDNLYSAYTGSAWTPASSTVDALASGRGFAWYLFDTDLDTEPGNPTNSVSVALPTGLDAAGNEPSGDVDVSVHGAGFDLLGNPFGDDLDVSGIAGWTGASALDGFVGQVYRCTPDASPTVECVGSYETTTSLGDAVPVWHGVFFETDEAGTLTIPLSAKGLPVTRTSAPRLIAFELAPEAGGAIDRAATLLFREGATPKWDGWDAEKLAPLGTRSVTLAFEGDRDGEMTLKAQESRPLEAASFEVPLSVASEGAGSELVLTWPRIENLPSDWTLTLTDRLTGATVDLRQLDRYAFTVTESAGREGTAPGATLQRSAGAARFTLSVQTGTSVASSDDEALELALDVPRPNPVTSRATVPYTLAESGLVHLSVLDVLGREVSVLAEGTRPAGPALAEWRTDGLAAGLYVLRLEAGGAVQTRQVVVTR
ncbi:MAG: hypothetical protein Rubg2KO_36260 [Rubricoccaceae bacterium]